MIDHQLWKIFQEARGKDIKMEIDDISIKKRMIDHQRRRRFINRE